MALMLLLIPPLAGCTASNVRAQQAEVIDTALQRQLRATDPRYVYFVYDDVFQQIQGQTFARRAPNAYNYTIELRVPTLASIDPGQIDFTPPASPSDSDGQYSDQTFEVFVQQYRRAYSAAVLAAMRAGEATEYVTHEIMVTVEPIDGAWVASKPYVGWVRDDIRAQLEVMLAESMEGSAEMQRLRMMRQR